MLLLKPSTITLAIAEKSCKIKSRKIKLNKYYSDHPCIIKIRKNLILSEDFKFKQVTESDIYKLVKIIDYKKSTGIDKIPPELVKKSVEVLFKPSCDTIKKSSLAGIFLDDAKVALFLLLTKDQTIKTKFQIIGQ